MDQYLTVTFWKGLLHRAGFATIGAFFAHLIPQLTAGMSVATLDWVGAADFALLTGLFVIGTAFLQPNQTDTAIATGQPKGQVVTNKGRVDAATEAEVTAEADKAEAEARAALYEPKH